MSNGVFRYTEACAALWQNEAGFRRLAGDTARLKQAHRTSLVLNSINAHRNLIEYSSSCRTLDNEPFTKRDRQETDRRHSGVQSASLSCRLPRGPMCSSMYANSCHMHSHYHSAVKFCSNISPLSDSVYIDEHIGPLCNLHESDAEWTPERHRSVSRRSRLVKGSLSSVQHEKSKRLAVDHITPMRKGVPAANGYSAFFCLSTQHLG